MLRLLRSSTTSIYPLMLRSLSAPTITTTALSPVPTPLPLRPRAFSVDSSRYAKSKRTATPPSQKRPSPQSHTHKKAQQDRGASKEKKKAELRAALRARQEALQQVRREREEVGEKKRGEPKLGPAEKKRVKKELLKEKKEKKMEEKWLAKEIKEVERFGGGRRGSGSPGKGAGARSKDGRTGWGLEETRASSLVASGRKRARSREASRSRGRREERGVEDEDGYLRGRKYGFESGPPFRDFSWKRGQGSKAGGQSTGIMVTDNYMPWEEEGGLRRGKAPPGKREREKMRLRQSRERSASMTRRDWASSLERAASPSRKMDLKERLRAVRLPPELMQRERDGRSASPQKYGSQSNSISSKGGEGGFRGGGFTQRREIHTSASSSYGGQSWREGWERRDEDRERWDDYRGGRDDYREGREDYRRGRDDHREGREDYRGGGGYIGGRENYRGGRQGYRDDYRQEREVRERQGEEGGGVSLKGYLHSPSHSSGGDRYRPPTPAPAYQSYTPSRQQEPIPETYSYFTKSYEDQQVSQESYHQREVEPRKRQRATYTRSRSPIADPQQGQHTSRRQYQNEWYPGGRSSPRPPPPAPAELIQTAPRAEPASRPQGWYSEREPRPELVYQHLQPQDYNSRQPLPFHEPYRPPHHHKPLPPALPIPVPTPEYLHRASLPSTPLPPNSPPNPNLIILDLNGTLLYRSKGSKATQSSKCPHPRPYLTQFLNYLFAHFSVMVWSSAQPANVASMVAAAFTPEQRERLVAVWGRDTLGLSREQMYAKVVVYKKLEKVWTSVGLSKGEKGGGVWSQANTVLVDDSAVKASAQPFNLVEISTWEGGRDGAKDRELLEVAEYLEEVRRGGWGDVSTWMRARPFKKGEWGGEVGNWFWGEEGGPAKKIEVGEGAEVAEGVEESRNKKKRMRRKARERVQKQQEEERAMAGRHECAGEGGLDVEIDMMGSDGATDVDEVEVEVAGRQDVPVTEEGAKSAEAEEEEEEEEEE